MKALLVSYTWSVVSTAVLSLEQLVKAAAQTEPGKTVTGQGSLSQGWKGHSRLSLHGPHCFLIPKRILGIGSIVKEN